MLKKYLMVSLLLALVFMVSSVIASAQTPDGATQANAIELQAVNTGKLLPLEERWYTFSVSDPAYRGIETLALQLFYENGQPVTSSDRTRYPFSDLYLSSSTQGQIGSGKEWTGQIEGGKQYWVQVINESDFEVDYVLTYNSDFVPPEPEPEPTPETIEETEVEIVPEEPTPTDEVDTTPEQPGVPFITANGATPNEATEFSLTEMTRGRVEAGTTGWRSVSFADPGNTNERRHLTITCFATPFDGNEVRQAQLRLYELGNAQKWNYDNLDDLEELGAVEFNLRHNMAGAFGDGNTPAQFIWDGWLTGGDEYVLAFKNGSDREMDFWCFPQQMDNAELGERSVRVLPNFDPGQAPSNPIPFEATGENNEINVDVPVTSEQQLWYSFVIDDPGDGEILEHVIIDMSFTPNNDTQGYNDGYRVNFDVYDAEDLVYWSVTDFENVNVQSFGRGSAIVRDNNPDTGEMTWDGWVVDGNVYYVQIRNGARYPIDAKILVRPVTAAGSHVVTQKSGIQ